jgi:hypothetical protein
MQRSVLAMVVFLAASGMARASAMRCPTPLDRSLPADVRLVARGGPGFSNFEGIEFSEIDAPAASQVSAELRAGCAGIVARIFGRSEDSREPMGIGKVPEPASMLFLGTSFIALGILRGRRLRP